MLVRAAKEGSRVLKALGYSRHQPFEFTLFQWSPEMLSMMGVRALCASRFAEVAFAMHARAARDEMVALSREFQQLIAKTAVNTPNIDALRQFMTSGQSAVSKTGA